MSVILYAVASEKAVESIEKQNELTLVVSRAATKTQVRAEVEDEFKEKIARISTLITPDGRKKAFVKFKKAGAAADAAAKLKIL